MKPAEALKCAKCGEEIEDCAFCDEPDCRAPACSECVAVALKERVPQPYDRAE